MSSGFRKAGGGAATTGLEETSSWVVLSAGTGLGAYDKLDMVVDETATAVESPTEALAAASEE